MNARSTGRGLSVVARRRRALGVFLTTLMGLGLFGVAGFAPTAQGQPRPPPIDQQICNRLVSVSYCSDPRNQSDMCWEYNNDACVQTLKHAYDTAYQNFTTGPTPTGQSPHGTFSVRLPNNMTNSGGVISGARVSYNQSNLRYIDHDLSYSAVIGVRQRPTSFGRYDLLSMTANTAPLHPEWESDGNAINDTDLAHGGHPCAEYVYKKYYDYSRFEDAAASCKSDYSCIYDVGVARATPGINHYPLNKKHGMPMPVQILPLPTRPPRGVQQAKNAFWKVDPRQFLDWFEYRNRNDVFNGIGAAGAQVQPYQIGSRWDWHIQMHDQQASEHLTFPTYEDMEERQKNISDLYDQFLGIRTALHAYGGPNAGVDYYDIMYPHAILSAGCADMLQVGQPCQHPITQLPHYPPGSAQQELFDKVRQIADALIAEWDHKSYADGTTVDHGCLDPHSNRCDWQPKLFAQEYTGLFRAEREKDFQTCFDQTGEVFSTANYPQMNPIDHSDTDHLDAWMANATIVRGHQLANLPWIRDAYGNEVVGRNTSGGKSFGDPTVFGVDYSYSAGYDATFTRRSSSDPTICGVQGRVGGNFFAEVQTFGFGAYRVINAGLSARAGQSGDSNAYANGYLEVFGVSLYSTQGDVGLANFNFSPTGRHTGLSYDAIIPVAGVIPVHLTAAVAFSTGLNWGVSSNGAPQNCDSSGSAALMTLAGNITPYANVSADLSAAIGVTLAGFGAEAGVRGSLTILQASLPVNVSMAVGDGIVDGQHYPSLVLNTGAEIDLSALSGSISAYAEVCFVFCESTEWEIYKWRGIDLGHQELFSLNQAYPLVALKTAHAPGRP